MTWKAKNFEFLDFPGLTAGMQLENPQALGMLSFLPAVQSHLVKSIVSTPIPTLCLYPLSLFVIPSAQTSGGKGPLGGTDPGGAYSCAGNGLVLDQETLGSGSGA